MTTNEIKASIERMIASVLRSPNAHNIHLLNAAGAKLLAMTGEVYSCGKFVKVA